MWWSFYNDKVIINLLLQQSEPAASVWMNLNWWNSNKVWNKGNIINYCFWLSWSRFQRSWILSFFPLIQWIKDYMNLISRSVNEVTLRALKTSIFRALIKVHRLRILSFEILLNVKGSFKFFGLCAKDKKKTVLCIILLIF